MLNRLLVGILAVTALVGGIFVADIASSPPAAAACVEDDFGNQNCGDGTEVPGDKPGGESPTERPAGFTPGPQECVLNGGKTEDGEDLTVDCSRDGRWWSNVDQCYWGLTDPQSSPPAGRSIYDGAWYDCVRHADDVSCDPTNPLSGTCYDIGRFLPEPPPGVEELTPGQAAVLLAVQFTLEPIDIGLAPSEKVHSDDPAGTAPYRRTWVGIPVWAWVENPSSSTWGPISETDTFGGVTVSGTASVSSLTWDTGDGQYIDCGQGTPFSLAYSDAAVDSPDCGWRYEKTSNGGTFTISATTGWRVEWSGGGQDGVIEMPATTSSTTVRVGELQSVNVTGPGNSFGDDKYDG